MSVGKARLSAGVENISVRRYELLVSERQILLLAQWYVNKKAYI